MNDLLNNHLRAIENLINEYKQSDINISIEQQKESFKTIETEFVFMLGKKHLANYPQMRKIDLKKENE